MDLGVLMGQHLLEDQVNLVELMDLVDPEDQGDQVGLEA